MFFWLWKYCPYTEIHYMKDILSAGLWVQPQEIDRVRLHMIRRDDRPWQTRQTVKIPSTDIARQHGLGYFWQPVHIKRFPPYVPIQAFFFSDMNKFHQVWFFSPRSNSLFIKYINNSYFSVFFCMYITDATKRYICASNLNRLTRLINKQKG